MRNYQQKFIYELYSTTSKGAYSMTTQSISAEPESMSANASSTAVKPKRYHPALVALHWLIALMIFGAVLLVQENEGGEHFEGERRNFGQTSLQQSSPPAQDFDADEAPQTFPQNGAAPPAGAR